ncbi:MAG: LamB/YcsF family protein [Sulfobacillus benefaciens]|uniref:5-oxoprolinase subunit A n=1 Tax=Sulfobacillus benefaciens TaxID=453960 RepID=A0A2T2XL41_9FIRM|nr:MAG: LamB/YcsF family protein [Sulfobacillus benefaciens]
MTAVDINCDLGEAFGVYQLGDDQQMMLSISSANVACGYHAGDPRIMQRTVRMAKEHGVAVGAHPGFPDLGGFGRRNMMLGPDEIYTDVLYQLGALAAFCLAVGVEMQHVKPHGQLNNMAFANHGMAKAIVQAIYDFNPQLYVISYGGALSQEATSLGLRVAHEIYADRTYHPDGTLVSRETPGSVIHDPDIVVDRVATMVKRGAIVAQNGVWVPTPIDTICVHGDTPGAPLLAQRIRNRLAEIGIAVMAFGQPR